MTALVAAADRNALQVTISQAIRMAILAIRAKRVPMIKGSPAIGKSAIVKHIAEQFNLLLIDVRLSQVDPTELLGFPQIRNNKASYVPMDTYPLEGDPIPEGYSGWLLFFDEFTSAPRAVQAAAYKPILDHMIGTNKLHPKCAIMCAGNKESDGAIVEEMSTAMQSRLIHMELVVDLVEWTQWASSKNFDHRILSYLNYMPNQLYTFKPDHTDDTYASPRTWEFTNDFLKLIDVKDPDTLHLLSGTISEGVTREFLLFCDIYQELPNINDIVATPMHVRVSEEPSVLFAITGYIAQHVTAATAEQVMKYVNRLPVEFHVVCLRQMLYRNKALLGSPAIQKWVANSGVNLF